MNGKTLFGSLYLAPGITGFHDPARGFVCTGSAMGRRNDVPDDCPAGVRLNLRRLPMVGGDYDTAGAYWGGPGPSGCMWAAWSLEHAVKVFVRATSREDAAAKVRGLVPGAVMRGAR